MLAGVVDAQVAHKRLAKENAAETLRQEKHTALLETVSSFWQIKLIYLLLIMGTRATKNYTGIKRKL